MAPCSGRVSNATVMSASRAGGAASAEAGPLSPPKPPPPRTNRVAWVRNSSPSLSHPWLSMPMTAALPCPKPR